MGVESQKIYCGVFSAPEAVYRLHRGEVMQRQEEIAPGMPAAFGGAPLPASASDADRRLALADWLGSAANPRTSRAAVNRIWQAHFRRGLVASPNDLGFHGGQPSHPELLDWLASEYVEHGWRRNISTA